MPPVFWSKKKKHMCVFGQWLEKSCWKKYYDLISWDSYFCCFLFIAWWPRATSQ